MDLHVIEPSGNLDGTKTPGLCEEARSVLANGTQVLLIDLKDTIFMDSSGLGALVVCLKAARSAGAKMYICSINKQVQMLFELTDVDRVFEIFDNRAQFEATILK